MFTKDNPYLALIKERYPLSREGSVKNTQHLVIDLGDSNLSYHVGDCIGVYPVNAPEVVEQMLVALHASGEERVKDQHGRTWTLREFLGCRANLSQISKKLLDALHKKLPDGEAKQRLETLLNDRHLLKEFCSVHQVWDTLIEFPIQTFEAQEVTRLLLPMIPRFYSIASSMRYVGKEVHLTVAAFEYFTNGYLRRGVCSHHLCDLMPVGEAILPIYIHPHRGFTIPEDDTTPIIMVGPGTGVAPYRGFIQERIIRQASGKNWLFFGECNRTFDFFYENEWKQWVDEGWLKLDVAFSRDQPHKVYVQHLLIEKGAEVWQWLQEGAIFYVCGDAKHMAKDVTAALLTIAQTHGNLTEEDANLHLKQLRKQKRFLQDVY
ncbi:MAG: sulfite reductase [Chlamydiia bacterium]|nr:sulfite reductase [Chlamydiia bacterium]